MNPFDFFGVPRIVFGRGRLNQLGPLVSALGDSALVLHNVADAGRGGPLDRLMEILSAARIRATVVAQRREPLVDDVDNAVRAAREGSCAMVLALGGGSAIDTAKAVAGLLTNGGAALDYMEVVGKGMKITKAAAPWVAIPTTAGTGAEATRNAVIGAPDRHFKASLRSEHLAPRFALVDAELGVDVPPDVTASSGMDALCQLIESYTSTGAGPLTDALAIKGITLAARSLRRVFENGHDVDAREDMALAALLSGITLSNAGLGAVHGFAAPLGANFPAPHGAICAALLPHVISANVRALRIQQTDHPALARYATIGRTIASRPDMPDAPAIEVCIDFTATLVRDLRIPPLGRFGLDEKDIAPMAALARKASSMKYNPVSLSDHILEEVLRQGIVGQ